ncbi:rhodanese-like domain-containing protein [Streptomyces sp. NPDC006798]|uniref:rhodanese-like domain-containing protein n=1 Tax=Streptomyces sp. NPDC006798 TaxID=3155462 RepID=UPI0033DF639A
MSQSPRTHQDPDRTRDRSPEYDADRARARLAVLTVIDVRTPGEYASGHLPGAVNVPLDQVRRAVPEIGAAAGRGDVLIVCASGARSAKARDLLAGRGVRTASLSGGTSGWAARGYPLERPAATDPDPGTGAGAVCAVPRAGWAMERQVRLAAGALILTGAGLGFFLHPAWLLLAAGVSGGLVFSALTDTCGMAAVLAKLPYNRPARPDLEAALERLRGTA